MSKSNVGMAVRAMLVGAFACGVIGLVAGVAGRSWKLGVTGWFTGGALLGLIAIGLVADFYLGRHASDG